MLRRIALVVVAAASLATLATAPPDTQPSAGAADDPPPRTINFGAYAQARPGQSYPQAISQLEGQLGRKLETVRVYKLWEEPFPDSLTQFITAGNRSMILSVKPKRQDGTTIPWSQLAAAAPGSRLDTEMRSWARRIKATGVDTWVTLHHEPETAENQVYGTAPEFIAAWRRWVEVFREEGVSNAHFMWIMTDWAFEVPASARNSGPKWFPGEAWVDAAASDSYNWHTCRNGADNAWRSLATIIEPFRRFGLAHPTVPLWLAEFGSAEDPNLPGRKASWVDDAHALFSRAAYSQFNGIVYFNWSSSTGPFARCNWRADTSESSLASFSSLANDPFYSGGAFGTPTTPPPNLSPTAAFTSTASGLTTTVTSTSTDSDGTIASTSWDFGDGTPAVVGSPTDHTYAAAGTYPVTLTVTDDDGATGSVTRDVAVADPVATPISFVAASTANTNATTHRIAVPPSVQAGDALVLVLSVNSSATVSAPTGLPGWRLLGTRAKSLLSTRVWTLVAPAGSAGRTISIPVSEISKGNLVLGAYRGTSATEPVASVSSALETVSRTTHTAPAATVAGLGSWVVNYWVHKDSVTTALSAPSGVTPRAAGTQTGSGRVTGLLADTGAPVSGGAVPPRTATAAAAKPDATMWTIVLARR
jgi:PKD repeat protein